MGQVRLPESFLAQMQTLLGSEYQAWLHSYEETAAAGIRMNRLKVEKEWPDECPLCQGGRVPWTENGYYISAKERPAKDPYYYAGLYYVQEPSAMAPAALLPVRPGDRVLDLCAAPGGKKHRAGSAPKGRWLAGRE